MMIISIIILKSPSEYKMMEIISCLEKSGQ